MRPSGISNFDRPGAVRSPYDHYTQWIIDHFSGLVSLWPLDEKPGATTAVDVVSGLDASYEGGATLGQTPGIWDGPTSVVLDGATGDLDAGDQDEHDFGASESFCVHQWVEIRSAADGNNVVFLNNDPTGDPGYRLVDVDVGSSHKLRFTVGDGNDKSTPTASTGVSTGWHYIVGVVDRSVDEARLYLNGALEDTEDISSVGSTSNSRNLEWNSKQGEALGVSSTWIASSVPSADLIKRSYQRGKI